MHLPQDKHKERGGKKEHERVFAGVRAQGWCV